MVGTLETGKDRLVLVSVQGLAAGPFGYIYQELGGTLKGFEIQAMPPDKDGAYRIPSFLHEGG